MATRPGRPALTPELAVLASPLVGALVVWALSALFGAAPNLSGLDPLGATLLLCGPIAVLAVWLAHGRWPRLAGLTSVSAMVALALAARAVIG